MHLGFTVESNYSITAQAIAYPSLVAVPLPKMISKQKKIKTIFRSKG